MNKSMGGQIQDAIGVGIGHVVGGDGGGGRVVMGVRGGWWWWRWALQW